MEQEPREQSGGMPEELLEKIGKLHEAWSMNEGLSLVNDRAKGSEVMKKFTEFAVSLGIAPDQVGAYFREKLRRAKENIDRGDLEEK